MSDDKVPPGKASMKSALDALRASAPAAPKADDAGSALNALRAAALASKPAAQSSDAATALAALRAAAPAQGPKEDAAAALDALRSTAPVSKTTPDDPLAALQAMKAAAPAEAVAKDSRLAALDALRATAPVEAAPADDPLAALEALFAADTAAPKEASLPASAPEAIPDEDPLSALFAIDTTPQPQAPDDDPLAALFAIDTAPQDPSPGQDPLDGLDGLLVPTDPASDPLAGLEALLAAVEEVEDPLAGLEDLLAASDPLAGLADLLDGPSAQPAAQLAAAATLSAFGTLQAPAPAPGTLSRPVFRLAVLGDFSGRASRGTVETGGALAARRAIRLDVDTVEKVIAGFATTLVLPIGQDGRGIAVPLDGLDSLHPDELVQNVDLFAELKSLRQRLSSPSTAARAVAELQGWAGTFTTPVMPSQGRSGAQAIPADRKLSDFQSLIGDKAGRLSQPSPAADLIGRIVGPHVVPGPNPEAKALRGTVDQAMAAAMRLVLHHPDFQATEAAWRTVDMLARRIETDAKLEVVLYDVSAEEVAADLGVENLADTGLFRLLAAPLAEEGRAGFSAVCALYTFEETPPHAALLGRLGMIGAHIQAPILTALSPAYLDTAKKDRNPLVAQAWDQLRADPVAHWLGVASPRYLMRRPYGAFSEPIDAFDFEEFSLSEGLSGMLWGNPAALAAVLLANAWTDGGKAMTLGKEMSLGDMAYHIVTDPHGDQVQLPCTERNMTTAKVEATVTRGLMPVIGIKGRDVVRLGSFQSLAGVEIAGRWSGNPPPARTAAATATLAADFPAAASAELDALLAGFGEMPTPADPESVDAELAALLEGL